MSESTHIDVNGYSVFGVHGTVIDPVLMPSSAEYKADDGSEAVYDSPLKISHSTNITGAALRVPQGRENAVDMNCVSNVTLVGEFGVGVDFKTSEGQVVTIKASDHVSVRGVIHGRPARQGAHISLGQHSDQGYQPTKHVSLDVVHADTGPVFLVTGNVLPWTIRRSPAVKWLVWESIACAAYVYFKRVVRFVLRIPKGVKGPSWL